MTMQFRDLADQAAADGAISPDEILALRGAGWSDGKMSQDEADALFAVNDRIGQPSAEWTDFFIEAISELIINGLAPRGYVSEEQGQWLIAHVDRDGRLDSLTELELLVKVIERALNVPDALKDYTLRQIEQAVLTGEGPTRDGGALDKGCICDAEVRLLRRVIFAQAGDRPAAVSQSEAELLFRIKDATLGAANSAEWQRLFVQGVGNFLMAWSSYQPLSPERAGELERFMDTPGLGGVGRLLGSALDLTRIKAGIAYLRGGETVRPDSASEVAAAEEVTESERQWLDGKINADTQLDDLEKALLDFLAEE